MLLVFFINDGNTVLAIPILVLLNACYISNAGKGKQELKWVVYTLAFVTCLHLSDIQLCLSAILCCSPTLLFVLKL